MKKLLLLDGNSMLFRAYYATLYTHRMTTSNGIPTNAVYGFVMMLNKAIDIIEPDKILVAWDAGKPTFRHKQFEAYKGTRKPLDEELIVQFPIVREYLDAAGIKRYEQEGYEADDIIGSMAKCCKDVQTTILTSDRDLLQLIDSSTHVLLMKKGLSEMDLMDEQNLMDTYGITPSQVIDMKGLMGDTADNIPGVAGVGEKTALRLLNQYSTVENVYAHIDEVKGKLKEKLEKETLTFTVRTGNGDRVFGSISVKQIKDELAKKGYKIDKNQIIIDVPISCLGFHYVKVELYQKINAKVKVHVIK